MSRRHLFRSSVIGGLWLFASIGLPALAQMPIDIDPTNGNVVVTVDGDSEPGQADLVRQELLEGNWDGVASLRNGTEKRRTTMRISYRVMECYGSQCDDCESSGDCPERGVAISIENRRVSITVDGTPLTRGCTVGGGSLPCSNNGMPPEMVGRLIDDIWIEYGDGRRKKANRVKLEPVRPRE